MPVPDEPPAPATWSPRSSACRRGSDPAEAVAIVAQSRRELLLRVHSFRLRKEDLEDCFGQATLELVAHARRGGTFASATHLAHVLEQRFISRAHDRRRALAGRSPTQAMMECAISIDGAAEGAVEIVDQSADVETLVIRRDQLRRICAVAGSLTPEQRLVIACQVGLQMDRSAFCERFGWSPEKYRKVAQRARARLRLLMAVEAGDVPARAPRSDRASGTRL